MMKILSPLENNNGVTLVEVLIALTIDFVVLSGIYAAFYSQQKSHVKEQMVVDAQQNVRGAATFMASEIRLAGLEHQGTNIAGILTAGPHSLQFTLDRNDDDDVADEYENIRYGFTAAADADMNGIADTGAAAITRFSSTDAPIADHIHALGFAYAFDDNQDGVLDFVDAPPFNGRLDPGEEIWAYDSSAIPAVGLDFNHNSGAALAEVVSFDKIRAVRIWILARTKNPLRGKAANKNFMVGDKPVNVTDNFQYRLLTATVKCRNIGL